MKHTASQEPPPKSTDLEGWRTAIAEGRLPSLRLEEIAAALQDLGVEADKRVRNPLAKHLSDALLKMLRRYIGTNHANRGEDIIYRMHGEIFEALLEPESADGRALREAFGPRVMFRAKDAIAAEYRHSRIPLQPKIKKAGEPDTVEDEDDERETDEAKAAEVGHLVQRTEPADEGEDFSGSIGDEAVSRAAHPDPALLQGVRDTDEKIDVERVVRKIKPYLKRLAFRLYMDGLPYKSKKSDSIAKACGVSDKTAEHWIEEAQKLLENVEEVKELKKVGDKS